MNWPRLRLTLDTKEDYDVIGAVYEALHETDPDFSAADILNFLKTRPEIVALNSSIVQKAPTLLIAQNK